MFNFFSRKNSQTDSRNDEVRSLIQPRLDIRRKISAERFKQLWSAVLSEDSANIVLSPSEVEDFLDTIAAYELGHGDADMTASKALHEYVMSEEEETSVAQKTAQAHKNCNLSQSEIIQIQNAIQSQIGEQIKKLDQSKH